MFQYFTWDCKFSVLPFHLIVVRSVLNNNNVTIQHSFPSRPQQRHKQQKGASVVTPLVFPTRPPPLTVPPIGPVKFEFFFFHSSESCQRSHLWTDLVGVAGCSRGSFFLSFFCLLWKGIGSDAGASGWVICELCNVGSARSIRQALWVAPLCWSFLCAACVGLGCFVLGNCGKSCGKRGGWICLGNCSGVCF